MNRPNWTTLGPIGGLILLVLVVAYFATRGNSDQDKLTNVSSAEGTAPTAPEKLCASKTTYDLIKRELFRRAAQLRGSDEAAFGSLAGYAVVRMENPVMESQDSSTGAAHCSASLSLDLPPGIAVVGGRRTLTADIDYSVQQAADGSGPVVLLQNADPIITPLATLSKVAEQAPITSQPVPVPAPAAPGSEAQPATPAPAPPAPSAQPAPSPQPARGSPSFNCANARTKGEIAVCGNAGLSALDRQMAAQFGRAMAGASPEQREILQRTRSRFLGYRDRCPNNSCIGDAYVGRMREIRDIMEGRWQPPR